MPPYNNVKSLQLLALDQVCKYVLDITPKMKKNAFAYREYFINNLHAWARTDILTGTKVMLDNNKIHQTFWQGVDNMLSLSPPPKLNTSQINKWLVIANTMLDVGVDQLPPLFLYQKEMHKFVSMLHNYNTHLKKLSITFQMSNKIYCVSEVYESIIILQNSLREGLASRLVVLKLVAICDYSVLKTIGEYALCLKHLDISSSWNVNDMGIKYLLFKSNVCVVTTSVSNNELCQDLDKLYDNESLLNRCCFTLEELHIHDTNILNVSLIMILACVKNLKSLGKFLQFKNVGDALITVRENSSVPRIFQITELYDMELTDRKINIFNECLPHLKTLYTGFSCICTPQDFADPEQGSMFWSRIFSLSIDLDYMWNFEFLNFVFNYGSNLSELILLDQEADIDVSKLLSSCPNLLSLKGYLHIVDTPVGQFTKLRSIELHTPVLETINWFFENSPRLEHAMLHCYSRNEYWNTELFECSSVNMCNNLKEMEISFNDLYPMTNTQAIIQFIDNCSRLEHLGRLEGWNLSTRSINKIRTYIKTKNYNLNIY